MPLRSTGEPPARSARLNRRRMLEFAGGATLLAALPPHTLAARQDASATPEATPEASPAAATGPMTFPIPGTLAADASPEFRTVAEALVDAMQRHAVPGVALGILANGREEHVTFGVASMSSLEPVVPETLFQIGSLSKTFTSTAIWHLHDRGAITIDETVQHYLPNLKTADPSVAETVRVANLLDHTPGWYGDEGFDTGDDDDAIARYVSERLPELPQQFPMGEFFSYNNAAFSVLGRLVEVATGTAYDAAMESLIFGPLGLADTTLDRAEVLRRPYADGHYAGPINGRTSLTVQTPLWVPRSIDPAGGIWSTTRDIIRYARFHLATGTDLPATGASVVSPESLLRMREPVVKAPGLEISMGRDWFVQDIDGVRVISHNGDTVGQHTEFFAIPEHGFAFVLFTNASGGSGVAMEVAATALATYPGLSGLAGKVGLASVFLESPDTPTVALSREELEEYAGRYEDGASVSTVTVDGEGLMLAAEPIEIPGAWSPAILPVQAGPASIAFTAKDAGLARGVLRVPFVRDDAGKVGWIASGLRLIPKVD